jgi:hypothetical protein
MDLGQVVYTVGESAPGSSFSYRRYNSQGPHLTLRVCYPIYVTYMIHSIVLHGLAPL